MAEMDSSNRSQANIYIKDPYVSKYVTEEKITEISFVGGVGGILGLFLGFRLNLISFFSADFLRPLGENLAPGGGGLGANIHPFVRPRQ
jgi:hypothetical protein